MKAQDHLIEKRAFQSVLSEDLMRKSIKLAEEHNSSTEKRGGSASGNNDQLDEMRAMIARQQEQIKALSANTSQGSGQSGKNGKPSGKKKPTGKPGSAAKPDEERCPKCKSP